MQPILWTLGLSILGIAVIAGGAAWVIGRSISRPLGALGSRMRALADGALDGEIPGVGRGDEVGAMAATVQIFKDNALRMRELEQAETATQTRIAAERRAAMESLAGDFERSVNGIVRSVSERGHRHADDGAIDDGNRKRRQRACCDGGRGLAKRIRQCQHGRCGGGRAVELGHRDPAAGHPLQRDREQGRQRRRAHQCHRAGAVDRRGEDR